MKIGFKKYNLLFVVTLFTVVLVTTVSAYSSDSKKHNSLADAFKSSIDSYQIKIADVIQLPDGSYKRRRSQPYNPQDIHHIKYLENKQIPNPQTLLKWRNGEVVVILSLGRLDSKKNEILGEINRINDILINKTKLKLTINDSLNSTNYRNFLKMNKNTNMQVIILSFSGWARERIERLNAAPAKNKSIRHSFYTFTNNHQDGDYTTDNEGHLLRASCKTWYSSGNSIKDLTKSCLLASLGLPNVDSDVLLEKLYSPEMNNVNDKQTAIKKIKEK